METAYLDMDLMEKMCHPLAVAVFDNTSDPISPFSPHAKELLDSALNAPRQTYGGNELYPTLTDKAAILFFRLIQNHPFQNGNKRIATASMLVFLHINNHWLYVSQKELANKAISLASSGQDKINKNIDDILSELKNWLHSRVKEFK